MVRSRSRSWSRMMRSRSRSRMMRPRLHHWLKYVILSTDTIKFSIFSDTIVCRQVALSNDNCRCDASVCPILVQVGLMVWLMMVFLHYELQRGYSLSSVNVGRSRYFTETALGLTCVFELNQFQGQDMLIDNTLSPACLGSLVQEMEKVFIQKVQKTLQHICDMIKGNESVVANIAFELQAKTDDIFLCFTMF